MSPELLDPEASDCGDGKPTEKSDCYAFGMVIYEILSDNAPFARYHDRVVQGLVCRGNRPERPLGTRAARFTNGLWTMLEQCWSGEPKDRPTIEAVLEQLDEISDTWQLLPPVEDDDKTDSDESLYGTTCSRSDPGIRWGDVQSQDLPQTLSHHATSPVAPLDDKDLPGPASEPPEQLPAATGSVAAGIDGVTEGVDNEDFRVVASDGGDDLPASSSSNRQPTNVVTPTPPGEHAIEDISRGGGPDAVGGAGS